MMGRVIEFKEKPQIGEGWINGGFFVLQPEIVNYIDGDQTSWEFDSLENIAAIGGLSAYEHHGFWQSMDTLRDVNLLNRTLARGKCTLENMVNSQLLAGSTNFRDGRNRPSRKLAA
jgi:glucose-1-phosphate cytidylyltransferase